MTPDKPKQDHTIEHIDLALSGGGFRATLFHLGVIGFLRSEGLLSKVRHICSVSGGSILAAHMVTRWDEYAHKADEDFVKAAEHLIDEIRTRDVTGRTLIRLRSAGRILQLKSLDPELLADEYRRMLRPTDLAKCGFWNRIRNFWLRLFKSNSKRTPSEVLKSPISRWEDLKWRHDEVLDQNLKDPQLHLLATHLNTGSMCVFTHTGFSIFRSTARKDLNEKEVNELRRLDHDFEIGGQDIARAVAASSAFPPIFGPLPASEKDEFKQHLLTDGGVYDNSGVKHLRALYKQDKKLLTAGDRLVVVSDAGRALSRLSKNYDSLLNLATRVSDTQGNRIAEFDSWEARQFFEDHSIPVLRCSIHDSVRTGDKDNHSERVQELLRAIRTELDKFSEEEVFVLYRHGFRVAQKQYAEYCRRWKNAEWKPEGNKAWMPGESSLRSRLRDDLEASLANSHEMKKLAFLRKAIYSVAGVVILMAVLGGPFGLTIGAFGGGKARLEPEAPTIDDVYKFDLQLRGDQHSPGFSRENDQDYVQDNEGKWPIAYGSGLTFYRDTGEHYEFFMITDRGPAFDGPEQDGTKKLLKLYLKPEYAPRIAKVKWNKQRNSPPEVIESYELTKPEIVNGLPPEEISGELNAFFVPHKRTFDRKEPFGFGIDPEDIALSPTFEEDQTFWICEEYRPAVMKAVLSKQNTVQIQKEVLVPGKGLPDVFANGQANRKLESIAIRDGMLIVAMQSARGDDAATREQFIWIARAPLDQVDACVKSEKCKQPDWETFKYQIGQYYRGEGRGQCSIGAIYPLDKDQLLVLEREIGGNSKQRLITRVNLRERNADGIVTPTTFQDLRDLDWGFEKPEGITLVDKYTIVISADNDFGLRAEGEVVLTAVDQKKVPLYTSDMSLFQTDVAGNDYRISWKKASNKQNGAGNGKQEKDGRLSDELLLRPSNGNWNTPFWVIKRAQAIEVSR